MLKFKLKLHLKGFFLLTFCILGMISLPDRCLSKSFNIRIDAKYIHTEETESNKKETSDEYEPKVILQYSHPFSENTDLSAEGRFNYRRKDSETDKEETKEPQVELRLKSFIYDVKTGYKETMTESQTENNTYGYFLIQPIALPDLKVSYDHDEQKDQYKRDKLTLKSTYKPTESLRLNFDLRHEYKNLEDDYIDSNQDSLSEEDSKRYDNETLNLTGRVEFDRTLSTRRPVKIEAAYKVESFYNEDIGDNKEEPKRDEINHTLKGKISYKLTDKTDIVFEYENKLNDDNISGDENNDEDVKLNLTQKFSNWLVASGRIRKENKHGETSFNDPNIDDIKDTKKISTSGHLKASLNNWLQFNFKAIDEQSEDIDYSSNSRRSNKTVVQGDLRSDFQNLFGLTQILDYSRTHDSKKESGYYTREERFDLKWNIEPIENLTLKPEYSHSIIDDMELKSRKITDEYEFTVDYSLNMNSFLNISLFHTTGRKRIRKMDEEYSKHREINDDSTFELDLKPLDSLYIVSQITRKDYRFTDNSPSEEMSYLLNFEWLFAPFSWSTSYKYNDKRYSSDSETFESKLIYDISDYMIEGEYKFIQTFSEPGRKEDNISLRLKMVF